MTRRLMLMNVGRPPMETTGPGTMDGPVAG